MTLTNRPVIVTGAAGRLGRVVTAQLSEAGARVQALDHHEPDELPPRTHFYEVDLTHESSVKAAIAAAAADGLWGLVHTVGMWDGAPLVETSLSDWVRVLDVNLTSAFLATREAVRRMDGRGRIVCIASRQGADGAPAEQAAYAASKAGVIRLVEATNAEVGPRDGEGGIAAVALAPSTILFGDEPEDAAGVAVGTVAERCVELCGELGAEHAGETLRIYGTG